MGKGFHLHLGGGTASHKGRGLQVVSLPYFLSLSLDGRLKNHSPPLRGGVRGGWKGGSAPFLIGDCSHYQAGRRFRYQVGGGYYPLQPKWIRNLLLS